MNSLFKKSIKVTAALTLAVFLITHTGWAEPAPLDLLTGPSPAALPQRLEQLAIPSDLGDIQTRWQAKQDKPFVIFIQDAHAVWDAQNNTQQLIEFLQKKYEIPLVAFEGAKGKLDATLFRSFPDYFVKKKVLEDYLKKGELTSIEMAAALNPQESAYYGMEDWDLYEKNYVAYLHSVKNNDAVNTKLNILQTRLDAERQKIYSKSLSEFHERVYAFYEEKSGLLDLLRYLNHISSTAGSSQGLQKSGLYPNLDALLKTIAAETAEKSAAQGAAIHEMIQQFKIKVVPKLPKPKAMVFSEKYQLYATGQLDAGALLKFMADTGESAGFHLKLTPEMRLLIGHQETLSTLKGTKLFEELEDFLNKSEWTLLSTPEEKKLADQYRQLRLLKDLAHLELTRPQWEDLKNAAAGIREWTQALWAKPGETLASSATGDASLNLPPDFSAHLSFYQCAEKRDDAFHKNLEDLLKKENARSAIVIAGGFHTEGFGKSLKDAGYSFAVITPKMDSLAGHETYSKVMQGELSYKKYLKTSFYDAFARDASEKMVSGLNGPDFTLNLKLWRENIIRGLSKDGHVEKAGEYTKYIDLLFKIYHDKYGSETGTPSSREIIRALEKETDQFTADIFGRLWKRFESQFKELTDGLRPPPVQGTVKPAALVQGVDHMAMTSMNPSESRMMLKYYQDGLLPQAEQILTAPVITAARSEVRIEEEKKPVEVSEYMAGSSHLDNIMKQIAAETRKKRGRPSQELFEHALEGVKNEKTEYVEPFAKDFIAGRGPQAFLEELVDFFLENPDASKSISVFTLPMTTANAFGQETGTWLRSHVFFDLVKRVANDRAAGDSHIGLIPSEETPEDQGANHVYFGTSIVVTDLLPQDLETIHAAFEGRIKPAFLKRALESKVKSPSDTEKMVEASKMFTSQVMIEIPTEAKEALKKNRELASHLVETAILQGVKKALAQSEVIQDFYKFKHNAEAARPPVSPVLPESPESIFDLTPTNFDAARIAQEAAQIQPATADSPRFDLERDLEEAGKHFIPLGNYHTRHLPRPSHEVKNVRDLQNKLENLLLGHASDIAAGKRVNTAELMNVYREYRLWLGRLRLISTLDPRYNLAFTKEGAQIIINAHNKKSLDALLDQLDDLYHQVTETKRDTSFLKWKSILYGLILIFIPLLRLLGIHYDFLNPAIIPVWRTLQDFRKTRGFYLIKFGGDEISLASLGPNGEIVIRAVGDYDKFKRYNQEAPRTDFDDNFYILFDAIHRAAKTFDVYTRALTNDEYLQFLRNANDEILNSMAVDAQEKPFKKLRDFKFQYEQKIKTKTGKIERLRLWHAPTAEGEEPARDKIYAVDAAVPAEDAEAYSLGGKFLGPLGALPDIQISSLTPYKGVVGFTATTTSGIGPTPSNVTDASNHLVDLAKLQKDLKEIQGLEDKISRFMTVDLIERYQTYFRILDEYHAEYEEAMSHIPPHVRTKIEKQTLAEALPIYFEELNAYAGGAYKPNADAIRVIPFFEKVENATKWYLLLSHKLHDLTRAQRAHDRDTSRKIYRIVAALNLIKEKSQDPRLTAEDRAVIEAAARAYQQAHRSEVRAITINDVRSHKIGRSEWAVEFYYETALGERKKGSVSFDAADRWWYLTQETFSARDQIYNADAGYVMEKMQGDLAVILPQLTALFQNADALREFRQHRGYWQPFLNFLPAEFNEKVENAVAFITADEKMLRLKLITSRVWNSLEPEERASLMEELKITAGMRPVIRREIENAKSTLLLTKNDRLKIYDNILNLAKALRPEEKRLEITKVKLHAIHEIHDPNEEPVRIVWFETETSDGQTLYAGITSAGVMILSDFKSLELTVHFSNAYFKTIAREIAADPVLNKTVVNEFFDHQNLWSKVQSSQMPASWIAAMTLRSEIRTVVPERNFEEFKPESRRFSGQRNVELAFNQQDFGALWTPANLEALQQAVTKNNWNDALSETESKQYELMGGRGIYVTLPEPVEIDGRTWTKIYLKGVRLDITQPLSPHQGPGFDRDRMEVDENGNWRRHPMPSPEGGMTLDHAKQEFEMTYRMYHNKLLQENGIGVSSPLGYGSFPGAPLYETPADPAYAQVPPQPLGFVILGIDSAMPEERMTDPLRAPNESIPKHRDILNTVGAAAKTLTLLHLAGFTDPYLHVGNLSSQTDTADVWAPGNQIYVHDLDTVEYLPVTEGNRRKIMASQWRDLFYSYQKLIKPFLHPAGTETTGVEEVGRSLLNRFVEIYFTPRFSGETGFLEMVQSGMIRDRGLEKAFEKFEAAFALSGASKIRYGAYLDHHRDLRHDLLAVFLAWRLAQAIESAQSLSPKSPGLNWDLFPWNKLASDTQGQSALELKESTRLYLEEQLNRHEYGEAMATLSNLKDLLIMADMENTRAEQAIRPFTDAVIEAMRSASPLLIEKNSVWRDHFLDTNRPLIVEVGSRNLDQSMKNYRAMTGFNFIRVDQTPFEIPKTHAALAHEQLQNTRILYSPDTSILRLPPARAARIDFLISINPDPQTAYFFSEAATGPASLQAIAPSGKFILIPAEDSYYFWQETLRRVFPDSQFQVETLSVEQAQQDPQIGELARSDASLNRPFKQLIIVQKKTPAQTPVPESPSARSEVRAESSRHEIALFLPNLNANTLRQNIAALGFNEAVSPLEKQAVLGAAKARSELRLALNSKIAALLTDLSVSQIGTALKKPELTDVLRKGLAPDSARFFGENDFQELADRLNGAFWQALAGFGTNVSATRGETLTDQQRKIALFFLNHPAIFASAFEQVMKKPLKSESRGDAAIEHEILDLQDAASRGRTAKFISAQFAHVALLYNAKIQNARKFHTFLTTLGSSDKIFALAYMPGRPISEADLSRIIDTGNLMTLAGEETPLKLSEALKQMAVSITKDAFADLPLSPEQKIMLGRMSLLNDEFRSKLRVQPGDNIPYKMDRAAVTSMVQLMAEIFQQSELARQAFAQAA